MMYNMGETPFAWFIATVVNVQDPHQSGRVQIRVYGRHDDTTNIPDSALPWALPQQSVTSAAVGRMGTAPVGLMKGSQVIGFWLDADFQYPIITGSIGKSGDLVQGETSGGAPTIDTTVGSIPPGAQGQAVNYRSQLNSSAASVASLDSTGVPPSISNTLGSIITKAVEKDMKNAKTPTVAYANKNNTSDILTILKTVDPNNLNASISCLGSAMFNITNILNSALAMIKKIAGQFESIVIRSIQNAILSLAQKYGVFKVLGLINAAAAGIAEVGQALNALANIKICGVNLINQQAIDQTNLAIAKVLDGLNSLTSFAVGAVNTVTNAVSSVVSSAFDTIVNEPLASVQTATSAIPPAVIDSSNVPSSYVQQFSTNDPYPGFIVWNDPTGVNPPVYTERNGEPNYTSADQASFFSTQNHFTNQIETSIISGNLSSSFLTNIFSSSISHAAGSIISNNLGKGFAIVGAAVLASQFLPKISDNINSNFLPKLKQSVVLNTGNISSAVDGFASKQLMLSRQMQNMRIGVGVS